MKKNTVAILKTALALIVIGLLLSYGLGFYLIAFIVVAVMMTAIYNVIKAVVKKNEKK